MIIGSEISAALLAVHTQARPRDRMCQLGTLAFAFGKRVSANRTPRAASQIVGKSTHVQRLRILALFLQTLRHSNYTVDCLDYLRPEHIRAVVYLWHYAGLATRTLQTRLAAIRTRKAWMGLEDDMPGNHMLLPRERWRAPRMRSV